MEIDLAQLPIPDWDFNCPSCAYPLRGLPAHRCPECGTPFDIRDLVRPWTRLRPPRFTGSELPLPDFGSACTQCHGPLTGAVRWACPHCGAAFDPETWRPASEWFIVDNALAGGVPIPLVQTLLASEYVPHAPADEKTAFEIFGGQSITITRLRVPREFYFEVLWLLRQARLDIAAARAAARRVQWRCRRCGARNPGHFEVCWNCQEHAAPPAT
jgi:predicted amidophosphoribosyltransferase